MPLLVVVGEGRVLWWEIRGYRTLTLGCEVDCGIIYGGYVISTLSYGFGLFVV